MARVIDTTDPNYQTRRTQFNQIVTFYGPILRDYYALRSPEAKQAWRQRDPFLQDILDFVRKNNEAGVEL